jgi:6-phosphogluconate dehydrogenase (decarboxylating)
MGLFIADGFVRMGLFVADGLQMALLQMGFFAVGHAGEASGRRRCYCFVVGGELAGHPLA